MLVTFFGCLFGILIVDILSVSFNCPRSKIKSEFIARLPDSTIFGIAITMGIVVPDMAPAIAHSLIVRILVTLSVFAVGKLLLKFTFDKIFK